MTPIALAAATGLATPTLFASARAAWSLVVDPAFVRPGHAVTSLLADVGQVTGPVLAAALYVATDWAAPLVCAATAVIAAALSVPRAEHLPGPSTPRPMPSLAHSRALRALLAVSVMLGIAVGLVQVAVPRARRPLACGVARRPAARRLRIGQRRRCTLVRRP